jgi:hypothetical protein
MAIFSNSWKSGYMLVTPAIKMGGGLIAFTAYSLLFMLSYF